MKRFKSFFALVVITCCIIAVSSCSLDTNQVNGDVVFIPSFSASTGRGLTSYRIEKVSGSINSNSIYQTFPILQSLQIVSADNLKSKIENSYRGASVWGFDIILETVKINPDGLYCLFSLQDSGYTVGFFDYYYYKSTKTFSLREMFLYTSSSSGSNGITFAENYGELNILEYLDMKIDDSNRYGIDFSSEEYDENGMLRNNIIATTIRLNNHTGFGTPFEGRTDGKLINDAWYYPYGYWINSIGVTAKSNDGIFASYTDPSRKWSNGGFFIDDTTAKAWFDSFLAENTLNLIDLEFIKEIIPYFFRDSNKILSYYFDRAASFSNYEEYKGLSMSSFTDSIASNTGVKFWNNLSTNGHKPLVFDYKNLTGYSLGNKGGDHYNFYIHDKDKIVERFKTVIGVDTVEEVVSYLNSVISDYQNNLVPVANTEYKSIIDRDIPKTSLSVETFDTIVDKYSQSIQEKAPNRSVETAYKEGVKKMSDYCGFGVDLDDKDYLSQFVAAHIKYCGITNENYIKNFISTVSLCDSVYTTEGITTEEPEEYRKKLVLNYLIRMAKYNR